MSKEDKQKHNLGLSIGILGYNDSVCPSVGSFEFWSQAPQ
jgi:hypothetical protein